jgi:serine protease AprX
MKWDILGRSGLPMTTVKGSAAQPKRKTALVSGMQPDSLQMKLTKTKVLIPSTLTGLLFATSLAFGGSEKIAKGLELADPDSTVDVIVQFKHPPTEAHHQMLRRMGVKHRADLHLIAGDAVSMPAWSLAALVNDPEVAFIAVDRPVHGLLDLTLAAVNAGAAAQYGLTGQGIGVAVIDSGIAQHADLRGQVVDSEDFTGNGEGPGNGGGPGGGAGPGNGPGPANGLGNDKYGHGTHVAGIIASSGESSEGKGYFRTFQGVAPGVNLINLRALDKNGVGSDSTVIAAIQRAIQLKNRFNIRVINLSLGRPVYESYAADPLCQAVEAAWKAGIVVVVAAGNNGRDNSAGTSGYGSITAPGNDPYVITVGAMKTMGTPSRTDDLIASYSSKGPTLFDHVVKPDIVAPGNQVVSLFASNSTLAQSYPLNNVPFSYYRVHGSSAPSNLYYALSGTSMATPVVSGAVALLLQQNPRLTPDQVKARLMKTAFKSFPGASVTIDPITHATYTSQYDIFTVGAGYLDIAAALNNTDLAQLPALSPSAVYDPTTNTVKLVLGNAVTWGTSLTWGTALIWGSNLFVPNGNPINGSALVWGTNSIPGLALIWGSGLIWGTDNPQAEKNIDLLINGEP